MKRQLLLYITILLCQYVIAQTEYISSSPMPDNDCIADLNGDYGVKILSKRNDLVISVTNVKNADSYNVTPAGIGHSGYFGYEVRIDKSESRSIKVEVNRRGDVYKTSFVVNVKPDFFKSYLIEEVERPIRIEDQTQANSAVLDEELAQVEFTTTIRDLQVHCPDALGAEVKKASKVGDNSIFITTISIPIKVLETAKLKREKAQKAHDELEARIYKTENAPDKDWETLDKLQEEVEKAEQELMELGSISISGEGTNKLTVDILDLKARQKMCYGVLLLKIEIPVDEFSAKVAEGGRLFALREYEGARRSFMNALQLKEAPMDLLPSVRTSIAHCDSCIKYEGLTIRALRRIKELKQKDAVAQTDIMNYYGAAADFMTIANKYNPCEYYAKNIKTLETYIENMPLAMRFTIARWIVQRVSAMEDGPFSGVELWAYYGNEPPRLSEYSSDRKFRHLVSDESGFFKQLGISDDRGIVDIELNRKSLPTGFFFRPLVGNSKSSISYTDATEVMSQSEGEYNKRQFRKKMYVKK